MAILFANNATSTLAGGITNTATTCNLASGSGTLFPNPTSPDYFCMTFNDAATGLLNEIVHVTARSGDTLTIVRAQEGTTALNWNAGDLASNLLTAGSLAGLATVASPALTGTPTTPTPSAGNNSTQITNTAWVDTYFAPIASPSFTGTPTAPTPSATDNSTKVATTAMVLAAGANTLSAAESYAASAASTAQSNAETYAAGQAAIAQANAENYTYVGYAPLNSPALTGTPTAPTQVSSDNSYRLATTSYVTTAVYNGTVAAEAYANGTVLTATYSASQTDAQTRATTAQNNAESYAYNNVMSATYSASQTDAQTRATTAQTNAENYASGLFSPASASGNGYLQLSGFILQWATYTTANSPETETFPKAFPHACLAVVGTVQGDVGGVYTCQISAYTTTGFNLATFLSVSHTAGITVTVFAIGY